MLGRSRDVNVAGSSARPASALTLVAAFSVAFIVAAGWAATSPPTLGARFVPAPQGAAAVALTPDGPLARAGVTPGETITRIGPEGQGLAPIADDLVEDPDMLGTREAIAAHYSRQAAYLALLGQSSQEVEVERAGATRVLRVTPATRHIIDLPAAFWIPIASALVGLFVGAWILSLRRGDVPARLFALSGFVLFLSAGAAAIYGARELALDPTVTRWLSTINHAGTLIFGAALVGLFLRHPRALYPHGDLLALGATTVTLLILDAAGVLSPDGHYAAALTAFGSIAPLALLQMLFSREDPKARAALRWLGQSVLLGVGVVAAALLAPVAFGRSPMLPQAYSFAVIAAIYASVALGVRRRGLFNVGQGAFRLLYYALGAASFFVLDAALALMAGLDHGPAMGLASLLVGTFFLPFRDVVWRKLFAPKRMPTHEVFQRALDVAFGVGEDERARRWRDLLVKAFDPLAIEEADVDLSASELHEGGDVLIAPPVAGATALALKHPRGGAALFSADDAKLVDQLADLVRNAERGRDEYARGVFEERARIARDLHDDLGARLVSGAIGAEQDARALSQEALVELRAILTDLSSGSKPLDEGLAELRLETARRAMEAGLGLDWPIIDEAYAEARIEGRRLKALRSAVREATTNAIRHAGASQLAVRIDVDEAELRLTVADDGRGVGSLDLAIGEAQARGGGRGFDNMRRRMIAAGGRFAALTPDKGAALRFDAPISWLRRRR